MDQQEVADADVTRLDGKHKGTSKYLYKDHIFYKLAWNNSTKETYVCSYANSQLYHCKVRITRNVNGKLILKLGKKGHEHDPNTNVLEIEAMKNKLRDAAKYPGKPHVIYDEVIRSYPNAALAIPLRVAAGIIDRVRRTNWITKAESLEELAERLSKHHQYKKYYRTLLHPNNGDEGTILFFADNEVLKRLNMAKNLYFDGNFKITSLHPESMQVWNILMDEHGLDKTETSFVGFAWCTNANQGTYRVILDYLKTQAPQLIKRIETIYTDFEQAAILAYCYELPDAKIHGCYSHYTQCVTKHFGSVKLSQPTSPSLDSNEKSKRQKPPKEILFVARVLPLLPADNLEEGIQVLANLIDKHVKQWPDLQQFKDYISKQWAGKAKLLSCFRETIRTNNKSKAFNKTLLTRFGGKHPSLGTFLYHMYGIISAEKLDVLRTIQSHRETRIQQNYYKNMRIKNIENALKRKIIDVECFLYQVMSEENLETILRERSYREEELYDENVINEEQSEHDDLQTFESKRKPIIVPEQHEPDYGSIKYKKQCVEQKQEMYVDDEEVKSYLIKKYPSLIEKFQPCPNII